MPENKERMPLPKITSLDDMFTTQEERDTEHIDKIQIIPRNKILPFPDHPFKVNDDEKMFEMVESIKEYGVLVPVILRPREDGFSKMILKGKEFSEKKLAGEELLKILKDKKSADPEIIGEYRGFKMEVSFSSLEKAYIMNLKNNVNHNTFLGSDAFGNIQRMDNTLDNIDKEIIKSKNNLDNTLKQYENAKNEAMKEFPQEKELREKLEKLSTINAELNLNEKESDLFDDEPDSKQKDSNKDKDYQR